MKRKSKKQIRFFRFSISKQTDDKTELPDVIEGNPDLMMWKELCRTGTYVTGGTKHVIDEAFLQNIVDVFFRRQAKGIEVPCPAPLFAGSRREKPS